MGLTQDAGRYLITQKNTYLAYDQHDLWLNLKHEGQKRRKVDILGKMMLDSLTNKPQISKV